MIGYLLRTLPLALRARFFKREQIISRIRRRVRLGEVDFNLHMNQAMYAQVMELGRTDWLLASGAWPRWRSAGITPIVAEQTITYRRELGPLAAYALDTRAVRVEGRLLVVEHHIVVDDRVHTKGEVKLLFVGPDGVVPASDVGDLCGGLLADPLPVEDWRVV